MNWSFFYSYLIKTASFNRKYATQMLKQGFIRHTVNKSSFSEQCYYVMSPLILELCGSLSALNLEDNLDSVSERAAATAVSCAEDGVQCRKINKPPGNDAFFYTEVN